MASSVPLVLPAFKALAVSALPAGSQVVQSTVLPAYQPGPGEVVGELAGITLQILGAHFTLDSYAELGPNFKHEEHYSIPCELTAWAGDPNYDQRTQDAYQAYNALMIAVANNPTLGLPDPKPRIAWTRQLDFTPSPDAFGRPAGIIRFEVQVQARVTSLT